MFLGYPSCYEESLVVIFFLLELRVLPRLLFLRWNAARLIKKLLSEIARYRFYFNRIRAISHWIASTPMKGFHPFTSSFQYAYYNL